MNAVSTAENKSCCPLRRLKFDDLHQAGIFTWPFLYGLGMSKLSRSKEYIRALRAQGLSREPQRGRAPTKPRRAG